jgi:sec-independent protein translocase protein TatA
MGIGALQPGHLLVILAIVLIVFGPGKLGNMGKALGEGLRELKKGVELGDGSPSTSDASATPATTVTRPCPNCRAAVPEVDKFCGVCGTAMNAASRTA